jgi:predicted transcriptional regulator of viral defense system
VRRGLYLAPRKSPPGGRWSPSEALAITTLINDRGGQYQVSGLNAFNRYGWDEQVPNRVFAYNNRISGDRRIGVVQLTLVKVDDKRLGGTTTVTTPEGITLIYASPARAILDAVYDWTRFGTIPRAYEWARTEIRNDERFAAELVALCRRFANQATIRRLGKLLETENAPPPLLRKLERDLRKTTSFISWNPTKPKRGPLDPRWGLVLNEQPT